MEELPFKELAAFVRDWAGLSRGKSIGPETEFERDLGITGDDGCDLLEATEKRFGVSLSSEEYGHRKTFNLEPDEFLFHSEGFGPSLSDMLNPFGWSSERVRAFTVGELYGAVRDELNERSQEPA